MPAKSALLEVLRDSSLSKDEMSTEALKCARLHNMSRARIEKILMDLYGDLSPYWTTDGTVKGAVSVLVECAFNDKKSHDEAGGRHEPVPGMEEPGKPENEHDNRRGNSSEDDELQAENNSDTASVKLGSIHSQKSVGNLPPSQDSQRQPLPTARAQGDAIFSACKTPMNHAMTPAGIEGDISAACAPVATTVRAQTDADSSTQEFSPSPQNFNDLLLEVKLLRKMVETERSEAKDREIRASRQTILAEKNYIMQLEDLCGKNESLAKTVDQLNKKITSMQSTMDKMYSQVRELVRSSNAQPDSERMHQHQPKSPPPLTPEKESNKNKTAEPTSNLHNQVRRTANEPSEHPPSHNVSPPVSTSSVNTEDTGTSTSSFTLSDRQYRDRAPVQIPPDKWHVVRRKKTKAKTEETKNPLGKLLGAQRVKKQVFYLGGINTNCSAEDIVSFCEDHCQLIECQTMPSKRSGTQAARLVVKDSDGPILERLEWPKHMYIRRWNFDKSRESLQERNTEAPGDTLALGHTGTTFRTDNTCNECQ